MISAFDVKYFEDGSAVVAAVVFEKFNDAAPISTYRKNIDRVNEYVPGSFYRRELPCILSLLADIRETIDTIIIDGYVYLGNRPGLGAYLKAETGEAFTIIGVAKSCFKGSAAAKVYRGRSRNPLYISASGMDQAKAADLVARMHGKYRIPTLLKEVDQLTKRQHVPAGRSSDY
ncbi:MAG: endonuclease V [Desulfobacterales bacterium]